MSGLKHHMAVIAFLNPHRHRAPDVSFSPRTELPLRRPGGTAKSVDQRIKLESIPAALYENVRPRQNLQRSNGPWPRSR